MILKISGTDTIALNMDHHSRLHSATIHDSGAQSVPSTPRKQLDLSEIAAHPLNRNKRMSLRDEVDNINNTNPPSPQTPILATPIHSPSPTPNTSINSNSSSNQLIYRGEIACPAPNIMLPNFSISAYVDTPRKSSPCKEY